MWHPSSSLSSHVHTSALWTAEETFARKQKSEYDRLQRHIEAHEGRLHPFHYAPTTASTLAAAGKNAPNYTQSLMLGVAGEDDDRFRTSKVLYPSSYGMSSAGQALDLAVATPSEVEAEAARIKMGRDREQREKKRASKAAAIRSSQLSLSRPGTSPSVFTFNNHADEETKSPSSTQSPTKKGGPTSPPFRDLSAPTGLSVGDHLATHSFASPNEASNFLATLGQQQRKEIYQHRFMGKVWGVLDKNQAPLSPAAALGYSSTRVVPNSALLSSLGLKSPIAVGEAESDNKQREMEQAEYYFRMSQKLQAENASPQIMTIPSRPGTTATSRTNNRTESALAQSLEKPLWNSAISATSPVKARTRAAISRNVFDVSDNDTSALAGHHFPSAHGHGRHTSLKIHQLQRPVTSHINQQKDKHQHQRHMSVISNGSQLHHPQHHGEEQRPKTSRAILSTSLESPRNAAAHSSVSPSRPRTSGGHHQAVNVSSGAVMVSNNSHLNSSGTAPAMGKFIDPKASSVHWSNRIYTKHSGSGMTKEQLQLAESMKAHQKALASRAARFKKGVQKSLEDSTMMNAKQREEQEMLIMQLRSEIGSGDEEEEKKGLSPADETANLFLSAATVAGNDYSTPQKDPSNELHHHRDDGMGMLSHSTLLGLPPSSSASLGMNTDPHSKPLPSQIRRDRKYSELESKFLAEFSSHIGEEFAQLFHDTSFQSYNAADQSAMNQQRLKLIDFEMQKRADLDVHAVAFQMKRLLLAKQAAENETRHEKRSNIEKQHWKTGQVAPQSNLMAAALQMHLKSIPTTDSTSNGNSSSLVKSIHDQLLKERLEELSFAKAEGATIAKGESDLPDLQHSVFSVEDSANAEQKARYISHFLNVAQQEQQEQIKFQNQILSEDSAFSHRFKIEDKDLMEDNQKKQRREHALNEANKIGSGGSASADEQTAAEDMTELEKSLTMARLKTEQSLQGQLSHFASKIEPAHLVALHQATNDVLDPKALVAAERAAERERVQREKEKEKEKEKEEQASGEEGAAKKAAAAPTAEETRSFPPAPVLTSATLAALHAAAPAARSVNLSTLHSGQQDPEELDSLNPPTAEVVAAAQKELRPLASILQLHNLSEEAQRLIDETAANVRDKLTVENASIRAENLLQAEKLQFQQARDREIEMAALVRHEKNQMALRATRRNLVRSGEFKFSLWGVHQIAKGVPKGCIVRFELKLMYSSPDLPMIVAYSTPFDPHAPVTTQANRKSTQTSVAQTRSNTPGLYASPASWNHSLKAAATLLTGAGTEADVSPTYHELFQSVTFPILNAHTQKLRVSLQVLTPRQMLHWLFSNRTELFHSTFSRAMTPLPTSRATTSLNNEAEFRTLMVYLQCCETDILNGAAVIAASPLNSNNKMKRSSFGATATPLPMPASARPKSSAALTSSARPPAFPTINPSAIVATAAMQQVNSARGGRPHTSHASTAVVPFGRSPQSLHAALIRPQTMQLGRRGNDSNGEVGDDQDPMVAYQRSLESWFNSGSKKSSPQPSPRQGSALTSPRASQQPHITARENAILTAVIDESDTDNFEKWLIHMRQILLSHKHFDSGLSHETHLVAPPSAPTSIIAVTDPATSGYDSDEDGHKMSYGAGLRLEAISKWSEEQVTLFLRLMSLGDTTLFHKREINGHQLLSQREELERFVEQTGAGRAKKFPARDSTNEELARAQPIVQGNAHLIAQGLATTGFSPTNKYKTMQGGKFSPALPSHVLVGVGGGANSDSGRSTPSTATPASGRTSRNHGRSHSISVARGTAQSLSWNPVEEATSKGSLQRASDALKLLRALQLLSGQFPSMSIDASKEDGSKDIIDMSHIAGLRKEIFRAYNAVCHMPSYVAAVEEAKNDAEARATTAGLGEEQIMDLSQRLSAHKNHQAETEAKNLAAIGVLPCDTNGNLIPPSDFSGAGSASATRAALLDKQMQAREAKKKHNEILSVLRTTQIRSMEHLDSDVVSQYKNKLQQRAEDRQRYQLQQELRQKQLQEDQKLILKQTRREQNLQNGVEIEDEDGEEDEEDEEQADAEVEQRRAQIQNQHLLGLPPRSSTAPSMVQPSPRGVPVVSAATYNMLELFQSRPNSRAANPSQALVPTPPTRPATGIAGLGTASRVSTAMSGGRGLTRSSGGGASSSSSSSPASNSNEGITIAYFELSVRRVARGIEGVFTGSMRLHAADDPAGLSASGTTAHPPVAPSAAPNGGITTGSGGIATLAGVGREGEDSAGRSLSSRAMYRSELETSRTLHSGSARTFMPGSATASMRQKRLAGSPAEQARSSSTSSSSQQAGSSSNNTPVVSAHTPRSWLRKSLQAQAEMEVHAAAWGWLKDARVDIEAVFTPSAEEIKDKE